MKSEIYILWTPKIEKKNNLNEVIYVNNISTMLYTNYEIFINFLSTHCNSSIEDLLRVKYLKEIYESFDIYRTPKRNLPSTEDVKMGFYPLK